MKKDRFLWLVVITMAASPLFLGCVGYLEYRADQEKKFQGCLKREYPADISESFTAPFTDLRVCECAELVGEPERCK